MQYSILLAKDENIKEVEELEQSRFIRTILEAVGIPIDFWEVDQPLSVSDKIKFRDAMSKYDISIIDDMDGGLKIYHEKDIIGEWFKCEYILKKDIGEIDPRKKLFFEMKVNFWSVFED